MLKNHSSNIYPIIPEDLLTDSLDILVSVEKKKYSILLAEDNIEVRKFIKSILPKTYNINESEDGQKCLTAEVDIVSDLILSDEMVPHMHRL